jgi:hypothetical protein
VTGDDRTLKQRTEHTMTRRALKALTGLAGILLTTACADGSLPIESPAVQPAVHLNYHSSAGVDAGYIDGWMDGETVQLRYSKSYFCVEPPSSGAASGCEIGADAETAPRPGNIRNIYAIAAVGFQAPAGTLACPPGSVCLNHPAMLDASRVVGPGAINIQGVPHRHIIESLGGGWHHTVNIRVFSLAVWNQIVAGKSLETVRALQADPAVGGAGLISQDTPTNIFFFIEPQPDHP